MTNVEVTWGRACEVWWSLVWRTVLLTVPATFVTTFILWMLDAAQYAGVAGALISIPVGIWVVKLVLGKSYSKFRLVLVSLAPGDASNA